MNPDRQLRPQAEALAAPLPPLLAAAEHLAATVVLGAHGRRRAGVGESFWQYRVAQSGDSARMIDWRRSARSDTNYVQDKEWQIAQTLAIWVDRSDAMRFGSTPDIPQKAERANVLALACAILLMRGGERIGLLGTGLRAQTGSAQLSQITQHLMDDIANDHPPTRDTPSLDGVPMHAQALFISDFLGDITGIETALTQAADRGIRGTLLQILDPQEEVFPFQGRTVFQSVSGAVEHETLKADALRAKYLDRLRARKDKLRALARLTGWQFQTHHTDRPASHSLQWLYGALGPKQ
jgi:uncharacterized protein (DUF58 family)